MKIELTDSPGPRPSYFNYSEAFTFYKSLPHAKYENAGKCACMIRTQYRYIHIWNSGTLFVYTPIIGVQLFYTHPFWVLYAIKSIVL